MIHNYCCPPRTVIKCQITPLTNTFLRINLNFQVREKLAFMLNFTEGSLEKVEDFAVDLGPLLDQAWAQYALHGAILLMPWKEELLHNQDRQSLTREMYHIINTDDPLLVLNILCRSRSGILLPNIPLALEAPFLRRDLLTSDHRLIEIARKEKSNE